VFIAEPDDDLENQSIIQPTQFTILLRQNDMHQDLN
jgi:hypothetical protein